MIKPTPKAVPVKTQGKLKHMAEAEKQASARLADLISTKSK